MPSVQKGGDFHTACKSNTIIRGRKTRYVLPH
jgi:hypothetical protein